MAQPPTCCSPASTAPARCRCCGRSTWRCARRSWPAPCRPAARLPSTRALGRSSASPATPWSPPMTSCWPRASLPAGSAPAPMSRANCQRGCKRGWRPPPAATGRGARAGARSARRFRPDAAAHQPSTLPFNTGRTSWDERSQSVWRSLTLRRLGTPDPALFGYGDPQGSRPLREAIAAYLRAARAVRCDPDQVVVTAGAQQAIDLVLRVLLEPGDAVWVEDPCYPALRAALAAARASHRPRAGRRAGDGGRGWHRRGAGGAAGLCHALLAVPDGRRALDGAAAGAAGLGAARRRLPAGGRLRQRVPLCRAAPGVAAGDR